MKPGLGRHFGNFEGVAPMPDDAIVMVRGKMPAYLQPFVSQSLCAFCQYLLQSALLSDTSQAEAI